MVGVFVSLLVPDKNGNLLDVVVGFKTLREFSNSTETYFGASIGLIGNRIAKGKFSIDGKAYTLFTNNGQYRHEAKYVYPHIFH